MPDDMAGIMKSTSDAALIFKSGGGVGINYSDLRQEGDIATSISASGPVFHEYHQYSHGSRKTRW